LKGFRLGTSASKAEMVEELSENNSLKKGLKTFRVLQATGVSTLCEGGADGND